jgi:hypothetical protein
MRQPSVFVRRLRPQEGAQLKRIARTAKQFARRQRAQTLLASASSMSARQLAAVVRTDETRRAGSSASSTVGDAILAPSCRRGHDR